jgi:hypothetical protein
MKALSANGEMHPATCRMPRAERSRSPDRSDSRDYGRGPGVGAEQVDRAVLGLGVVDDIEGSLVVEGQVVADAAVLLQREALVRAVVLLSDADLAAVNLVRDEFHGEWNYVIRPQGC